jgi:ankyrin repeat protein
MIGGITSHTVQKFIEDVKQNPNVLNKKDQYGRTQLQVAARYGYQLMLEVVLLLGADGINEKDDSGMAPIHRTAYHNGNEIRKMLVMYGADIDARMSDGDTAMHTAALWDNEHAVTSLYMLGSKAAHMCNEDGRTPFKIAKQQGNASMMRLLRKIEREELPRHSTICGSSVHAIASKGDVSDMILLLSLNSELKTLRDETGNLPLHHAVEGRHVKMIELLADDIDATNNDARTPLHLALRTTRTIVLLHRLGTQAHFSPDKSGVVPAQNLFVRKLYFSRSLCETLFYINFEILDKKKR